MEKPSGNGPGFRGWYADAVSKGIHKESEKAMVIRMDASPAGVTVWLSGELDHHAARSLREQIDGAVDRTGAKELRLDFEGVTFMDSSGIGLVMGRYRLMRLTGGKLTVTGASERIQKVMRLAGLDKLQVLAPPGPGEPSSESTGASGSKKEEQTRETHQ